MGTSCWSRAAVVTRCSYSLIPGEYRVPHIAVVDRLVGTLKNLFALLTETLQKNAEAGGYLRIKSLNYIIVIILVYLSCFFYTCFAYLLFFSSFAFLSDNECFWSEGASEWTDNKPYWSSVRGKCMWINKPT